MAQDFNFDQNPFEAIFSGDSAMGGAMPSAAPDPSKLGNSSVMQKQMEPMGPKMGPDGKPLPDVTQRGQNPGTSKFLVQGMNAIQGALSEATNPEEIRMLRQVILLITRLIERDQQGQEQAMGAPSAPQGM